MIHTWGGDKRRLLKTKRNDYSNQDDAISRLPTNELRYIDYDTYLPTPPLRQDMTQGQFLSGV